MKKMKCIMVETAGDASQLHVREMDIPKPGKGEILVKQEAIGVNFIDIYRRSGLYPTSLPFIPGLEGAGTVAETGGDTVFFKPGDRVAYGTASGTYGEFALLPESLAVPLPGPLSFRDGAAAMLQGMTVHYLTKSTYPLKKGESCLIHAAAGGVGRLLVQRAKKNGVLVIATVSTREKGEIAKAAGADYVILYTEKNFKEEVLKITGGKGVQVVFDSVGVNTFTNSLGSLAVRGTLVSFGQASGKIPPVDPAILGTSGSLYLTRPSLFDYVREREDLLNRSRDIFDWIASGEIELKICTALPLENAAEAHILLEERKSTGKVLLIP